MSSSLILSHLTSPLDQKRIQKHLLLTPTVESQVLRCELSAHSLAVERKSDVRHFPTHPLAVGSHQVYHRHGLPHGEVDRAPMHDRANLNADPTAALPRCLIPASLPLPCLISVDLSHVTREKCIPLIEPRHVGIWIEGLVQRTHSVKADPASILVPRVRGAVVQKWGAETVLKLSHQVTVLSGLQNVLVPDRIQLVGKGEEIALCVSCHCLQGKAPSVAFKHDTPLLLCPGPPINSSPKHVVVDFPPNRVIDISQLV
mmetsp:Transcript_56145/g.109921  ORF Transcript_56145/g.109921 Transcript_56145/m.109921 type:complete len:258 (-) Transcript_56145:168-941(-)